MKLVWPIAVVLIVASGLVGQAASAAPAPSQWEQPAASLAEQIAGILGPGQARLTIRNVSTIPSDEIPAIRHLLEQDLKIPGKLTATLTGLLTSPVQLAAMAAAARTQAHPDAARRIASRLAALAHPTA